MEKPPVNTTNKIEQLKAEQPVEHFPLSEQEKNIQDVLRLNPELKEVAYNSLNDVDTKNISFNIEPFGKSIDNIDILLNNRKIGYVQISKNNSTQSIIVSGIELKEKGNGKKVYLKLQEQYPDFVIKSDSKNISEDSIHMWDSLVDRNLAIKNGEKDYTLDFSHIEKSSVELYSKYLETIFPESKYKEIGFKGVSSDFPNEDKPSFYTKDIDASKYYSQLREGNQIISAVFNFQNPLIVNAEKPAPIPIITPDGKTLGTFNDKDINEKIISAGYDGLILNRKFSTPLDGWEILSFNSNTRHILGTEYDKERFKEFISKTENNETTQSIEEFLKENGIEHVPHIETNFLFHKHATKEDGENVASKLDNTDILIHENAGWDKERLETWRKISRGEFTADEAIEYEKERGKGFWWNDYYKAIFDKLHGSNKEVLLVDVESDDEVFQEIYELLEGNSIYNNLVNRESSYEETLEQISNYSELESLLQKERENKILENMKTNLLQLLKENPELQNKKNLNILFPMGAFHTRLYHETKKRGDKVSQEFSASPYTFDSRSTIERKIHFLGIEKAQEDMPKVLLYWLLRKSGALSTNEVPHKFVSKFSDEQIKELFNLYQKSKSDQEFKPEALNWITKYFRK